MAVELRVVPYEPEHFLRIQRKCTNLQHAMGFGTLEELARIFLRGPAYTGFANEEIVGCGGIMLLWRGVGEAWAVASPLAGRYPKFFHKTIRQFLAWLIEKHRLERVQAMVDENFEAGLRWAWSLGFRPEGPMAKYLAGRTYIRFARITEFGMGGV